MDSKENVPYIACQDTEKSPNPTWICGPRFKGYYKKESLTAVAVVPFIQSTGVRTKATQSSL